MLVERYAPLVWSICRRHRLGGAEASEVGQTVWLRLVDELATVNDQAALPGWLATATLRECGRVLRGSGGSRPRSTCWMPGTSRVGRPHGGA